MNKFERTLSKNHEGILDKRRKLIASKTRKHQEAIVRDLESEMDNLNEELFKLEDIYPYSSESLSPTVKDFDPKKWTEDYQRICVEKEIKSRELKVAQENYRLWFMEDPEEMGSIVNIPTDPTLKKS